MGLSKFWYLTNLGLHQRLPDDVYRELREQARLERWGHRADIFRQDDRDDVSLVMEGRVGLQESGRHSPILLGRGDLFGHVHQRPTQHDLTLRAEDDTMLAVLSPDEFREVVAPHLGKLATRVGLFTKRRDIWMPVEPLLFTTPKRRLAHILLHLVEQEGATGETSAKIPVKLAARKLADLSGINPSRVRELLSFFKEAQILELGRGQTRVLSLDELRAIADGES
ncbi:MAG: Crp/Fnr family transcriptional regulator [Myxococcota bacterium]